ncbi:MAG: SDR family NAD(P)-dependent oxidoreductase [Gammaproteobacteria bacterium]
MKLENKVAVITGGASGMGRATVLRYLAEGAKVIVADFNADNGADTLREIERLGYSGSAAFVKTDVATEQDVEAALASATDNFGRLDIVFNNAGVGGAIGPVWDIDEAEWDYTFDVLAKGVMFGIKHAARIMRRQNENGTATGGSIINTASVAGMSGGCGPLVYSAAKAAVINLTRAAAIQLAPDRIRVNSINPGFILTGLTQGKNLTIESAGAQLDKLQPNPDHGTGDDIAGAALFLASDDSRFINGESIVVDGGLTALGPDLWQRFDQTYERDLKKNYLTRGTTGEESSQRKLNE